MQVSFPSLKKMVISLGVKFNRVWSDQLSADSFCKLEDVEFSQCGSLKNIFQSSMLGRLNNLTMLSVWQCYMVEEVFEIPTSDVQQARSITPTQLSSLHLYRLSNLKRVWSNDPRGILAFSNLHKVYIYECPSLENLFPYSIAKSLLKLEILCVIDCGIKEIVSEEEGSKTKSKFVFPQLTDLRLLNVPHLVSFYPALHTSEWPLLNWLVISECMDIEVFFVLECLGLADHHNTIQQQYLFLTQKVRLCILHHNLYMCVCIFQVVDYTNSSLTFLFS